MNCCGGVAVCIPPCTFCVLPTSDACVFVKAGDIPPISTVVAATCCCRSACKSFAKRAVGDTEFVDCGESLCVDCGGVGPWLATWWSSALNCGWFGSE